MAGSIDAPEAELKQALKELPHPSFFQRFKYGRSFEWQLVTQVKLFTGDKEFERYCKIIPDYSKISFFQDVDEKMLTNDSEIELILSKFITANERLSLPIKLDIPWEKQTPCSFAYKIYLEFSENFFRLELFDKEIMVNRMEITVMLTLSSDSNSFIYMGQKLRELEKISLNKEQLIFEFKEHQIIQTRVDLIERFGVDISRESNKILAIHFLPKKDLLKLISLLEEHCPKYNIKFVDQYDGDRSGLAKKDNCLVIRNKSKSSSI